MLGTMETAAQTPDWLVVVLGLGVVFVGLLALVGICTLFGQIFKNAGKHTTEQLPQPPQEMENRAELVAAISAALAEELGTDVKGLRIVSLRRL